MTQAILGHVLRVACVQMEGGAGRERNLAAAARLVARAASDGASLVVLPERWECVGAPAELRAAAVHFEATAQAMREWAREHGVWLVGGSVSEPAGERLRNTTLVFSPEGEEVARYTKIHLFDVEVPGGLVYRESATDDAGGEVVCFEGPGGIVVGLSICYDLRFPELYRALADRGAQLVVCPSSFTAVTGAAHWHVLLRARAIENACFVAAATQAGEVQPGRPAFGHALVVDPWGELVAEAPGTGEAVVLADVDRARVREVRATLPALAHRRPDVYA